MCILCVFMYMIVNNMYICIYVCMHVNDSSIIRINLFLSVCLLSLEIGIFAFLTLKISEIKQNTDWQLVKGTEPHMEASFPFLIRLYFY